MKRLMMYLKDYKKESILAPLFKLLEAFFELLVPLVMANIIDYGISNRNMGYIGKMGLLLLLLGVVGLASSITAQFFAAKAAVGFSTQLRQALFDHIEDLSFTDIDKACLVNPRFPQRLAACGARRRGAAPHLRVFVHFRHNICGFSAVFRHFKKSWKNCKFFMIWC